MKWMYVIGMCLLMVHDIYGQSPKQIEPVHLELSHIKTTNLLFPYAIKSVDRGSRDVLAQKANGVENVLQVKAGRRDFEETNLSVITADGKLYSFLLHYQLHPSALNLQFSKDTVVHSTPVLFADSANIAVLQANAEWVHLQPPTVRRKRDHHFGMELRLIGLYIEKNVFYFQVQIRNETNIGYDVELLRYFSRDRKQSKRTVAQEVVQDPLLVWGNSQSISGKTSQTVVVAIPKFTIPDKKEFVLQIMERNGGRHLRLKVSNKIIVQVTKIQ